jgi:hypothetical protein
MRALALLLIFAADALPARAQDHQHQHEAAAPLFPPRDASGTAWLPDDTPMQGLHHRAGAWEVMVHGSAFAQFLYEGGEDHRRSHQAGSINWLMGMARRPAGGGRLGARAMLSAEPWTIPGCGYPDLLATGETCDGDTIHDRQHPHDLFMELAAEYDRPLRGRLRWQIYAALAGEPALGPAGFPHRLSAAANPIAPIGHHWLDATHISFGVLTAGVFTEHWKVDASAFNGREPDERRDDLDLAAPDSFAARLSLMPSPSLVVQVSGGHLKEAEPGLGNLPRTNLTRATASATYHRPVRQDRPYGAGNAWATTIAWGLNVEPTSANDPASTTHAALVEASYAWTAAATLFGRLEVVGKPAHDLHVHDSTEVFTVAKLQLGYSHDLMERRGARFGVGGTVSGSMVPASLVPRYGARITPGFGVFLTVGPSGHATR